MLALDSPAVIRNRKQPPTEAARHNWQSLLRCVQGTLGYVPDDLRLEWADFTGDSRHFGLVIFQDDGTATEVEFYRRGRRWFCHPHDVV